MTNRNTRTNLVVLLCRCLALTSCLFPFSTLSVVSNASSYNRSVRDACELNCVISSFCSAEISNKASSVPLTTLANDTNSGVSTLSDQEFVQILPTWNYFPVQGLVVALLITSIQIVFLLRFLCSVTLSDCPSPL
jgi:hypothetical protein